mmetsp:Transcript_13941/g.35814  ORF Transcript_13941/g.35814 Transcript_13941/m.35814 type:complete len:250 (+) Transcript_13941:1509-2258(+)
MPALVWTCSEVPMRCARGSSFFTWYGSWCGLTSKPRKDATRRSYRMPAACSSASEAPSPAAAFISALSSSTCPVRITSRRRSSAARCFSSSAAWRWRLARPMPTLMTRLPSTPELRMLLSLDCDIMLMLVAAPAPGPRVSRSSTSPPPRRSMLCRRLRHPASVLCRARDRCGAPRGCVSWNFCSALNARSFFTARWKPMRYATKAAKPEQMTTRPTSTPATTGGASPSAAGTSWHAAGTPAASDIATSA